MAIRTQEEMLAALNQHLGDDHSDEALSLIEDLTDTLNSLNGNAGSVNWEQRYRDNDAEWRRRYRDRFFGKGDDNDNDNDNDKDNDKNKPNKPRTFADLFKK